MKPLLLLTGIPLLWLTALPSSAQITVNSTGVVGGTVTPPNLNPNFNQGTTRIITDSQGRYFRNGTLVYIAPNPNLIRMDSNGRYFVDFRGIPVVSTNGTLTSPVLSDGQLTPTNRFNNNSPVRFWGNIQDEFVVQGNYTGIATNPATGQRYQGTFAIRGQGPRYSDANGGTSPTVFDFQSHYNFQAGLSPTPTVFSYSFSGMPVRLTVTIPAGLQPLSSATGSPAVSPGLPGGVTATPGQSSIGSGRINSAITNAVPNSGLLSGDGANFAVNRVVLDAANAPTTIGPKSRVLLR